MTNLAEMISNLENTCNEYEKLHEEYLAMFKLSGYNLYTTEGDPEGKERPKTVKELLAEALKNPPSDDRKYIEISSIPRYISEYLIVPQREDLDRFNDRQIIQLNTSDEFTSEKDRAGEIETTMTSDDDQVTYKLTGEKWNNVSQIPISGDGENSQHPFVDSSGEIWVKKAAGNFIKVYEFDPRRPDFYDSIDLQDWGPFKGIEFV